MQLHARALLSLVLAVAAHVGHGVCAAPTVTLDNATVTGSTSGSINHFLGIPYAQSPTGNLRFRLPQPLPPYDADFSADAYGNACPQQPITQYPADLPDEVLSYLVGTVFLDDPISGEDCLNLNVLVPADATPESELPVVVWIFPGAFEFGGTFRHNGVAVVEKSILLDVPVVYVSMNFRQNAFGFLASKEVKDAGVGNLGLQDQRLALRWVQKYIRAFGGDPIRVTIWGYSSGASSVGLHLVTNEGNPEGLFRAAFVQGAGVLSVGDITNGQPYYDALVAETGCSGASNTLQCLRELSYKTLFDAVMQSPGVLSYQSMHIAWLPRVDGVFLTANPLSLVQQGIVADVPVIFGNCDDEGTLFSLANLNVTTEDEFGEYIKTYYFPDASSDTIAQVMEYYPGDPTQGSPYGTGYLNMLSPQFKRLAALQGDLAFHGPRRLILQTLSGKQDVWTYISKRLKLVPFLGSFHASDLPDIDAGLDVVSYLVRFVTHLDPNVGGDSENADLYWPRYDATGQTMLAFLDGPVPQALTTDTFRTAQIAYVMDVAMANLL